MKRKSSIKEECSDAIRLRKLPVKGRWRWFAVAGILLVGLAWFAPAIICKTELRHQVLAWAAPELSGRIHIGEAQVSWMGNTSLANVLVRDLDDQDMVSIDRVQLTRGLWQLIRNAHDLGNVEVVAPKLTLVLREDGSNLQDLLNRLPKAVESSSETTRTPALKWNLRLTDGTITFIDQLTGRATRLHRVDAGFKPSQEDLSLLSLQVSGHVDDPGSPGEFQAEVTCRQPSEWSERNIGSGKIKLVSGSLPLVAVKPLLQRVGSDISIEGALASNLECTWTSETAGPVVRVTGNLDATDFAFASPSILKRDQLRDERVRVDIDGWLEQDYIRIEKLDLKSSLAEGTVRVDGPFTAFRNADGWRLITDGQLSHRVVCKGSLDLPRIVASLPTTLRMQPGTTLREGTVDFDLGTESVSGIRAFQGRVATKTIAGERQGQPLEWREPMAFRWDLATTAEGTQLREMHCESSFLTASGRGDLARGDVQIHARLGQLATELGQFFDLGATQLRGDLKGRGQWQTTGETLIGDGDGTIDELEIRFGDHAWREARMSIRGKVSAVLGNLKVRRLEAASLTMESGSDRVQLALTEAVAKPTTTSSFPVKVNMEGNIVNWLERARPWIPASDAKILGGLKLATAGQVSAQRVSLVPVDVELTEFRFRTPSVDVAEPRVVLQGAIDWDAVEDQVVLPQWTLACSALAARGQDFRVAKVSTQPQPAGAVAFRGDLAKLARMVFTDPTSSTFFTGTVEGQTQFAILNAGCDFRLNATATPFAVASRPTSLPAGGQAGGWVPWWHEDRLSVETQGRYSFAEDLLSWQSLRLTGDALTLNAQGKLRMAELVADLAGDVEYDWDRISTKFRTALGPQIQIRGKQRQRFRVTGPLLAAAVTPASAPHSGPASPSSFASAVSPELLAEFGVGWDQLRAYGVEVGAQQIQARLERGIVDIAPLDMQVQGGRIRVDTRMELATEPMSLVLEQPASVEGLQLTPEMFRSWMRYVTPVLADATTAQGSISLHLQEGRIPLLTPAQASLSGKLVVDQATVQPGPLAQQFTGIISEVAALSKNGRSVSNFLTQNQNLMTLNQQQVEFQLVQGRVYHRNLEVRLGDAILRSQGSVGLDQSLSLLAEIPLLDKWIGNERLLESLKGQTLQLPIHGSLTRPEVDRRGIAQLTRDAVGSTAERVLQDELQKGLQKLLGPK